MQHVFESFLNPLTVVFGPPNTEDQDAFLAEYARLLQGYSVGSLKAAKDAILRSYKGPSRWPKIAECVHACEQAIDSQAARSAAAMPPPSDWRKQAEKAERLMKDSTVGYRAAHEGWANGCRDFVMEHNRLPTDYEIPAVIGLSRFVERAASGQEDLGVMHNDLVKLAKVIRKRNDAITDRMLGETRTGDET